MEDGRLFDYWWMGISEVILYATLVCTSGDRRYSGFCIFLALINEQTRRVSTTFGECIV